MSGDRLPYDRARSLTAVPDGDVDVYADIRYAVVRGFRPLLMHLRVPRDRPGPVPAVMWIHGGGWVEGSHLPCADDTLDTQGIWDELTGAGMAVASVQYRHSSEATFPSCVHDVKAGVRWLRAEGPDLGLDPDGIGAIGESAGGYLAAFLAMNTVRADLEGDVGLTGVNSHVRAGVSWYGPSDLPRLQEHALPDSTVAHGDAASGRSAMLGATLDDNPEIGRWASPATYVGPDAAPLLLGHGDADYVVPVRQSLELHRRLRAQGVESELILVPGADHAFVGGDPTEVIAGSVLFLRRSLATL